MEEYIYPIMVKLTGENEALGDYGAGIVIVIGLAWLWY